MKTVFVVLLLVSVALSANMRQQRASIKGLQEMKQTKWGMTLLKMIQMHTRAKGAVQELIDAIEELINDLDNALEELEFDFQYRTNTHNSQVIALEQAIQDAEQDVARSEDLISNLLVPRQQQVNKNINQIVENQEYNRQTLAENTLTREQDHETYETLVTEYNEATAAVDEALELIDHLSNPSLIQSRRIKNTLSRIPKNTWKKVKQGPIISALVQLATSQNFADQDVLGQVVEALNEFRNDVVDALNQLTLDEAQAVEDFEERVDQLDHEYAEFQRSLAKANNDLAAVLQKIEESQEFLNQRDQDRKLYVEQLELEQENFAQETEIYTDLKNEYLRELAVSEQGLSIVESVDFSNINVF